MIWCSAYTSNNVLCLQEWSVIGKLPYRVKTTLVGFWDGWLYFTSGQRDKGPDDPAPKKVIGEMWRTKLKLNSWFFLIIFFSFSCWFCVGRMLFCISNHFLKGSQAKKCLVSFFFYFFFIYSFLGRHTINIE